MPSKKNSEFEKTMPEIVKVNIRRSARDHSQELTRLQLEEERRTNVDGENLGIDIDEEYDEEVIPSSDDDIDSTPPPPSKKQKNTPDSEQVKRVWQICKTFRELVSKHSEDLLKKKLYYPLQGYGQFTGDGLLRDAATFLKKFAGNVRAESYRNCDTNQDKAKIISKVEGDLRLAGFDGLVIGLCGDLVLWRKF